MNQSLLEFMKWFLEQPIGLFRPRAPLVHDKVITQVIFREGQFQVEHVTMLPGHDWPGEHRHPHVDSFEVEMFGCTNFTRNGKVVTAPDLIIQVGRPIQLVKQNLCVYLSSEDWHGIPILRHGASLLSIQHWKNAFPSSVGLDWEGQPVSEQHAQQLKEHGKANSEGKGSAL